MIDRGVGHVFVRIYQSDKRMQLWERLSMFRSQYHPLLDQLSLLDKAHWHCLKTYLRHRKQTADCKNRVFVC